MNTVQSKTKKTIPAPCEASHLHTTDDHYWAMRKAMRDAGQLAWTLDIDLLIILKKANVGLVFSNLWAAFNSSGASHSKFTYYAALDRLVNKGYARQEYGAKGWRHWFITPTGRVYLEKFNAAAQAYLNKKAG